MRELTITERKAKTTSEQMWSIVEPYMTVEDIEFTRSYRDADEWEILMALSQEEFDALLKTLPKEPWD